MVTLLPEISWVWVWLSQEPRDNNQRRKWRNKWIKIKSRQHYIKCNYLTWLSRICCISLQPVLDRNQPRPLVYIILYNFNR